MIAGARYGTDLSPAGAGLHCQGREPTQIPASMPESLIVLIAGLALAAVLEGASLALGGFRILTAVRASFDLLMVLGLFRGSEGCRNVLYGLSLLGLVVSAVGAFLLWSEQALTLPAAFPLAVQAFAALFCVWCLRRPAVRQWMFSRTPMGRVMDGRDGR